MTVVDASTDIRFVTHNDIEKARAHSLHFKETGTIEWLNQLQPGDVFYDVGANIGCYSLYAAYLGATVVAIEPHCANVQSLLANIAANNFRDITVYQCAVGSERGFVPFHYLDPSPGSSGSQVYDAVLEGRPFTPRASQMIWQERLDRLISENRRISETSPRTLLKIDVDGREDDVLVGLPSLDEVTSVQVEVGPNTKDVIDQLMLTRGFSCISEHFTANGKQMINSGADPSTLLRNAIYERR